MRFYEEFVPSGQTYDERTGPATSQEAAIGAVTIQFADLEDTVAGAISQLLGREPSVGVIVTAEMSFRNKVNLMSSLARHEIGTGAWKPAWSEAADALPELSSICFKAEELRNGVVHTSWEHSRGAARRIKRTAKAKGLRAQILPGDAGALLDVADYISYVVLMVENFFAPHGPSSTDCLQRSLRNVAT